MEEPRNFVTAEFEKLSGDLRNSASTCFVKCNVKGFSDSDRLNACVGKDILTKGQTTILVLPGIAFFFYIPLHRHRDGFERLESRMGTISGIWHANFFVFFSFFVDVLVMFRAVTDMLETCASKDMQHHFFLQRWVRGFNERQFY